MRVLNDKAEKILMNISMPFMPNWKFGKILYLPYKSKIFVDVI